MTLQEKKILLESDIIRALREIFDPEIPVNIYDLGLIYNIDISDSFHAKVLILDLMRRKSLNISPVEDVLG